MKVSQHHQAAELEQEMKLKIAKKERKLEREEKAPYTH